MTMLTPGLAARFAELTLGHVGRPWPFKLDQVLTGPDDVVAPAVLHPAFHGSFDWHSCVHGWWQLMRIARLFPDLPQAVAIRERADATLTAEKLGGERAYLDRPGTNGFERPYGWGWALALHHELERHDELRWADAMRPLAEAFAARLMEYLPKLTYPVRTGTHGSTAFALILALEWADARDPALAALIRARAVDWFGGDRGAQAWEPGGDDFLSATLVEAVLMARVLGDGFGAWFAAFLPDVGKGEPATLFLPATVSDRSDGKIAHLDGLNLSRAWCWFVLADAAGMPGLRDVAMRHLDAALGHVAGDYMGEHWLATFALLALGAGTAALPPQG
ncbi:DUF2891 domain-containing protein [Sphingomonas prati]|uniref:DUF2891 domain-containing protein n=1 Tax=Sphingomonas prati TaxID=1843237 RepID=A0A7W9F1Y2_9SPHN|nr:DUF2891 domain-containing protein [Sphingomonas prati]MBB5727910.1 hypothetical protein [Sphingomonas prati]